MISFKKPCFYKKEDKHRQGNGHKDNRHVIEKAQRTFSSGKSNIQGEIPFSNTVGHIRIAQKGNGLSHHHAELDHIPETL